MKVFPLSLADDARQWWINEGEGKITTWEELVERFFYKFYLESHDGEDEMLDEGDNHMKVDGRTKKGCGDCSNHQGGNGGGSIALEPKVVMKVCGWLLGGDKVVTSRWIMVEGGWLLGFGLKLGTVDITEFFRKLKFIFHWADPIEDLKWSNVPGVKLSSLSESNDTFLSLQALLDLYYLFGGFMDYLWSRKLDISNFGPVER
ncbi:hypothetical protein Tco_0004024 [Tanacetum coccineum]